MKSNLIKHGICLGAVLLASASLTPALAAKVTAPEYQAQQPVNKVTGTVTDDVGEVIGASVMVKGTTIGTVTDMEGKFTELSHPFYKNNKNTF